MINFFFDPLWYFVQFGVFLSIAFKLDPIAAADFLATLGKINRELGTTVVLTEHRLVYGGEKKCTISSLTPRLAIM